MERSHLEYCICFMSLKESLYHSPSESRIQADSIITWKDKQLKGEICQGTALHPGTKGYLKNSFRGMKTTSLYCATLWKLTEHVTKPWIRSNGNQHSRICCMGQISHAHLEWQEGWSGQVGLLFLFSFVMWSLNKSYKIHISNK